MQRLERQAGRRAGARRRALGARPEVAQGGGDGARAGAAACRPRRRRRELVEVARDVRELGVEAVGGAEERLGGGERAQLVEQRRRRS